MYLNPSHPWPKCIRYKESCPSEHLSLRDAITMLDGVADAVKHMTPPETHGSSSKRRVHFAGQIYSNWDDKMYDKVLRLFKPSLIRRHTQMLYIPNISNHTALHLCDKIYDRPNLCESPLARFKVLKSKSSVGHRHEHMERHIASLASNFSKYTLDVVLFDTVKVFDNWLGSVITNVHGSIDTSYIFRAHNCSGTCRTVYLDDYRYETSILQTNTHDYDSMLRILRWTAQAYMIIRVIALFVGSYYTKCLHPNQQSNMINAIRLGFHVSSQVVVYSSTLPITLYAIAYLIDSSSGFSVSDLMQSSLQGKIEFNAAEFFIATSISMRSIWYVYC